jgi:hypothetical protein
LYEEHESDHFQLDDRYFGGLEGQYRFQLSFRLHRAGESEYIVRSHGNYCMRRSVTAELELEPGEYHVLVKIEAEKYDMSLPVEDVLRNNVKSRRDKLLRIGRAYDLAHAKGQILESNEEKARREKLEAQVKAKARKEMKEKLMKEKQRRKHVENKEARKAREAAAKRKAKAKAKEAAKKERKGAEKCQEVNEKEQKGKEVSNETKEKVKPETAVAKNDDKTAKSDPSEAPHLSDAKVEDRTTGDSADGEPTAAKETQKNTSPAEETKESDPPTEKNNAKERERERGRFRSNYTSSRS